MLKDDGEMVGDPVFAGWRLNAGCFSTVGNTTFTSDDDITQHGMGGDGI